MEFSPFGYGPCFNHALTGLPSSCGMSAHDIHGASVLVSFENWDGVSTIELSLQAKQTKYFVCFIT
ncbi:conserved hypothetical protein [Ricinus communis]|uniref:Uncharacterized protein n=1 Tax=Ricinus communis TaxID=3988 RepID=B9RF31_RICCO|nr:conserved hypothetical protein [Ricinus communis]